jgi:hypothetical protein
MEFTAHGIVELGLRSLTLAKFVKPIAAIEQRPYSLTSSYLSYLRVHFKVNNIYTSL